MVHPLNGFALHGRFSLPHKIDAEPQLEALLGILGQRL